MGTLDVEFKYHWNIKGWREVIGKTGEALEHFCIYDPFYISLTKVIQKVKDITSYYCEIGSEKLSSSENNKHLIVWFYKLYTVAINLNVVK